MAERFTYRLMFESGTQWMYGCSVDWVGKLIERVTDQTLEEYMKKNIWEPLGLISVTFFPCEHPELRGKIPGMSVRTPDGQLAPYNDPFINTGSKDALGGHRAYAKLKDFLKVQGSILANDGKLLKPETVEMMFTPQLSPGVNQSLNDFRYTPMAAMIVGENNSEIEIDWGIGSILFLHDDHGRRKGGHAELGRHGEYLLDYRSRGGFGIDVWNASFAWGCAHWEDDKGS